MQKDFHYCTIKTLAQTAGFGPDEAQTIAYASQYVDDAVEHEKIPIKGLAKVKLPGFKARMTSSLFDPICTAHKGLQYLTGWEKDVQKKVYISFHFVPAARYPGQGDYDYRSQPGGSLARELVESALADLTGKKGNRTQTLIRLGIALHSYADTWSHAQFSGRHSGRDNDIERIRTREKGKWKKIPFWKQEYYDIRPSIGHAEAHSYPDQSHLEWKYEHDHTGVNRQRNNTEEFLDAANAIFRLLCGATGTSGDWKRHLAKLRACFEVPTDEQKKKFQAFRKQFPEIDFDYHEKTWRREALDGETFDWLGLKAKDFLALAYKAKDDRKWFYFHLEASKQRKTVMDSIRQDLR